MSTIHEISPSAPAWCRHFINWLTNRIPVDQSVAFVWCPDPVNYPETRREQAARLMGALLLRGHDRWGFEWMHAAAHRLIGYSSHAFAWPANALGPTVFIGGHLDDKALDESFERRHLMLDIARAYAHHTGRQYGVKEARRWAEQMVRMYETLAD